MTSDAARWRRHVVDGRHDGLDFSIELPEPWALHAPAAAVVDFAAEPARLVTLLEAGAGVARLTVAARPSEMATPLVYSATYLMVEHGIEPDTDGDDHPVGLLQALSGSGWRRRADGRREALRYAYCEDGGRLLHLCLSGDDDAALACLWPRLLSSFRLLAPRGQRQPLLGHPAPPPCDPGPPAWWARAQALQREGHIEEAVALVGRECPYAGALLSQAELWAREMQRLAAGGDLAAARAAHRNAAALAWSYAAGATSGGEGAALSLERDRFLAELGPAP